MPLKRKKIANEDHYLSILFLNSQPDENDLSPAHKLFNHLIRTNLPSVKPQAKPGTIKTAIELETQNRLSTLKPGDKNQQRRSHRRKLGIRSTTLARTASSM